MRMRRPPEVGKHEDITRLEAVHHTRDHVRDGIAPAAAANDVCVPRQLGEQRALVDVIAPVTLRAVILVTWQGGVQVGSQWARVLSRAAEQALAT